MSRAVRMAEFARILGVNRSTVTRAKQAGRLVLDHRGHVLVDESLERYQATAGGRVDVAERHAEARGAEIPNPEGGAGAPATTAADESEPGTRKAWKRQALEYDNLATRLEQQLRRHQRYNRAEVRREAEAIGGTLRAAAERLVDEAAPQLTIASPAARQELLERQSRQIRRVLKSELARALYRLRASAGGKR